MKLTITPTDIVTMIDGVPARLWAGVTEGGVRCEVFVVRIQVRDDADVAEFERALAASPPPREFRPIWAIDALGDPF
jgi:hypothetical protein